MKVDFWPISFSAKMNMKEKELNTFWNLMSLQDPENTKAEKLLTLTIVFKFRLALAVNQNLKSF